jgi:ABC-type transport system substrate-binding protein
LFGNLKVRQALNYAINKTELIKLAFSGYVVPTERPVRQLSTLLLATSLGRMILPRHESC